MGNYIFPDSKMSLFTQRIILENQLSVGARSFYIIAFVTLINRIFSLTGIPPFSGINLAVSRLFESLIFAMAGNISSEEEVLLALSGIAIDFLLIGLFIYFGFMGKNRHRTIVLAGIIFYIVDGIIGFLLFFNLGILLFHALFLISPIRMYQTIGTYNDLELIFNSFSKLEDKDNFEDYEDFEEEDDDVDENDTLLNNRENNSYIYDERYENKGNYQYDDDYKMPD